MSSSPRYVIVGSDGSIGTALLTHLNRQSTQALGTTRRQSADSHQIYMDLAQNQQLWVLPPHITTLINCAAVAQLEACQRDPVGSQQINVEAAITLAERCQRDSLFYIYLSTDKVFSGQHPHITWDAPFSPITEYGRQKAETEACLLNMMRKGAAVAIIRLTKVFTPEVSLFRTWRDALLNGEPIHPFVDMTLAPVTLPTVLAVIERIVQNRRIGVFQVSGDLDVTYAEVAQHLAVHLQSDSTLVQPITGAEAGQFTEMIPLYTSLDVQATQQALSLKLPSTWEAIDWALDLSVAD